ncbi:PREDICTED: taste receptor type 2 member 19-like, partial [Galeopterus variegatus]|uniref:Taste receptor type 2 member 19-like n=1 Tax=Galeopterus variegatus TaxID=482537 RepID=A0ABM0Q0V1_GALVR
FLKIANFSNPVFLHLKHRLEMIVLVIVLGTLVFMPFNLTMISIYISIQIHSYKRNMTSSSRKSDTETFSKLIIFTMGSFIPFSASLSFFLLLIFSLWKHLKNMKVSATGFRDPSVSAHMRAMISVMFSLSLFAIYFLSLQITTFHSEVLQNKLVLMFVQTTASAYPSVHTLILILANGELRKASLLVLWQLRCC